MKKKDIIYTQSGFTLVELLIVIAILGILAVGLIAALNPGEKLAQAGDARVINDIGVMSRAGEAYFVTYLTYPHVLQDYVASQLKYVPTPPSGYTPYYLT